MSDVQQHVIKNSDGTISIGTTQDVGAILARNVFEANNNINRKGDDTFGRKVASIPTNIINDWCKEWGCNLQELQHDPEMKARMWAQLRDPANSKLRTDRGKV